MQLLSSVNSGSHLHLIPFVLLQRILESIIVAMVPFVRLGTHPHKLRLHYYGEYTGL